MLSIPLEQVLAGSETLPNIAFTPFSCQLSSPIAEFFLFQILNSSSCDTVVCMSSACKCMLLRGKLAFRLVSVCHLMP